MTHAFDPEGRELDVLRAAADFSGARVLEVGCGDGRITFQYAPLASSVVGIDPDFKSLAAAERNYPEGDGDKVQLLQASAEALPLRSNTFDIALLAWSL